jgi:prepilin-type N-terminal cleavage/methylation domain-containing protein
MRKRYGIMDDAETCCAAERGFSLLEVVVVMLMAAVITAMALPKVNNAIKAYNLRSAANHLAERLSAVRALAVAKNKNVTFSFNNSSGRYGFDFTGTEGDGVPDTTDPDALDASYYWEILPSGITTTFPGNAPIKVTFSSRGELPIGATEKNIILQNSNNTTLTVSVNLRGNIYVH